MFVCILKYTVYYISIKTIYNSSDCIYVLGHISVKQLMSMHSFPVSEMSISKFRELRPSWPCVEIKFTDNYITVKYSCPRQQPFSAVKGYGNFNIKHKVCVGKKKAVLVERFFSCLFVGRISYMPVMGHCLASCHWRHFNEAMFVHDII